jgi:cell division protein FtsI (penicillin-binding protein 3)
VPDRLQVSVHPFTDHDPHPPMDWTITDILTQSSNIGTIKVAQELGPKRVDEYLRKFGLGQASGLGFPRETRGIMLDLDEWTGTSIGSIPIGQGVAVTALQLLQVYNTLANDGVWVAPRLVRATVDGNGHETPIDVPESRRVVSSRTAQQMTAMLQNVVRSGTGMKAAIDGYAVGGKTGTARKPDLVNGSYETGAYISSFAGFIPGKDRQLSAVVVLDEPRPIYYANLVVAPVWARIAKYALRQLRIPPAVVAPVAEVPEAQAGPVSMKD